MKQEPVAQNTILNREQLRLKLMSDIRAYEGTIKALVEELSNPAKRPIDVLEWAEDELRCAAELGVRQHALKLLNNKTVEDVLQVAQREALRGALWPKSSTSTLMNLAARYTNSAWASLLRDIKGDV